MDNQFVIELQAILDKVKSQGNINSDIRDIQLKIDKLKLQVEIDPNSISKITRQLEAITNTKITLSNISVNEGQLANTGKNIGKLISENAENSINNVSSKSVGKYFKIDETTSNQFRKEMQNLVSEWTNTKGKLTDIKIDTRTSYDDDSMKNITRLHQATVTYKNELDEVIRKTIAWRQIGTNTDINGNEVAIRGFVEVAGQYSKSIDVANIKTDTFVNKQKQAIANLQNTINQISSHALDQNTSKPIKSDDSLAKLNYQIKTTKDALQDLKSASSDTFTDSKIKVEAEISSLKILVSQLRNTDIDLFPKISVAKNELDKFKASARDFPQITNTIRELDAAFSNIGDATSFNSFNDQLRIAKSELAKFKQETLALNREEKVAIKVSGLQSSIANLQKGSPAIDDFKAKIGEAEVTVQSLYNDLLRVNTQNDFSVVNEKFKAFTKAAKAAGISVSELTTSVQKQEQIVSVLDHVTFENQIRAWMRVNSAGKQYFNRLEQIIAKSHEVDNALDLNKLIKEFNVIKTEAKAAGNVGKSFTDTFKANFDKFGEWGLSSSFFMNFVQGFKSMISNVHELSDAQLELSKVSDLSVSGLKRVTEQAYKLGETVSKTGIQTLNAITSAKRAGYTLDESMSLAEDALKLTNVAEGITDAGVAMENLIHILKGSGKDASYSSNILDMINEVDKLAS